MSTASSRTESTFAARGLRVYSTRPSHVRCFQTFGRKCHLQAHVQEVHRPIRIVKRRVPTTVADRLARRHIGRRPPPPLCPRLRSRQKNDENEP